jgi:hypothetical protein
MTGKCAGMPCEFVEGIRIHSSNEKCSEERTNESIISASSRIAFASSLKDCVGGGNTKEILTKAIADGGEMR